MLKDLERNTVLQIALLLVVALVLWGRALVHPDVMPDACGYSPLYSAQQHTLAPRLAVVLSLLLSIGGGLLLNLTMVRTAMVPQHSLLPTLFFLALMGSGSATLTPTAIVALFSVIIVDVLMLRGTLLSISANKIGHVSVLIGICTLFYQPAIALLITYLMVAINYRLYGWREWMVMLLGFLAPYLLFWMVFFLNGTLLEHWSAMLDGFTDYRTALGTLAGASGIANIVLVVAFAASFISLWGKLGEKTLVWKKNAASVMLFTVAGVAMLPYGTLLPIDLKPFAVPAALCLPLFLVAERTHTHSYRRQKTWRNRLSDVLFVIIFIAILIA